MMNISQLRQKNSLTQEQIAEQLNIDRSAIARWEAGKALPRADKLPELAKILNCTIDELFTDNSAVIHSA